MQRLRLAPGRYVLATVHRAENTDAPARLHAIMARHARGVACEVAARPGIGPGEILAELARLERAITLMLLGGALDTARDSAHQLLGAARLFTRGELEGWCLRLEAALRERRAAEIAEALERVQRALRDLGVDADGVHGTGNGAPGA